MNIAACAAKLLSYFSPEERSIPDVAPYLGRNAAVIEAMNSAMQDLFGKGKPWVRYDRRGALLYPPASVPITVTQGSTVATISAGNWKAWYAGCTIVIPGAEVDNQIRNNAAAVKLKFPYSGTSGVYAATIYHDSIEVDADVLEIHEPVQLNQIPLVAIPNANSITVRKTEDFGFHMTVASDRSAVGVETTAGTPVAYSVETWSPDDVTPPRSRIRIYPATLATGFLEYPVMLCPPRVADLASITALPIPFNFIESIFLPIATKKLRGCPFWRGIAAEEEVEANYKNALELLGEGEPRKTYGARLVSRF